MATRILGSTECKIEPLNWGKGREEWIYNMNLIFLYQNPYQFPYYQAKQIFIYNSHPIELCHDLKPEQFSVFEMHFNNIGLPWFGNALVPVIARKEIICFIIKFKEA